MVLEELENLSLILSNYSSYQVQSGAVEPGQLTVLLTGPIGVVALSIGGITLRFALLLLISRI